MTMSVRRPPLKAQLSFVWKKQAAAVPCIRKTKIVCTLGPASSSVEGICALLEAGMDVARLNFSHGNHESHLQEVKNVREASARVGKICAILLDNKGPEIRTGKLKDGSVVLTAGSEVTVKCTTDTDFLGDATTISMDYPNLPAVVKIGGLIRIDDGLINCRVLEKKEGEIKVSVENTGELGTYKGVNLPGAVVDLPALTERDMRDIGFAVTHDLDFVAASFTRKADDVIQIRKVLGDAGKNIKIICKIENQEGLDNFDEILEVADGIMVARGDLGVEIPIQKVVMAQKMMIKKCNLAGKPVITATQMLDSMIKNPRPTRAECTDVANAVFDGTDCVMLSGETAKGAYPSQAVEIMSRICATSELTIDYEAQFQAVDLGSRRGLQGRAEAITSNAVRTALGLGSKVMLVVTQFGTSARLVAKYKPNALVVVVTSNERTARQCLVSRALHPLVVGQDESAVMATKGLQFCMQERMCEPGAPVVLVFGICEKGMPGGTDTLKIVTAPSDLNVLLDSVDNDDLLAAARGDVAEATPALATEAQLRAKVDKGNQAEVLQEALALVAYYEQKAAKKAGKKKPKKKKEK